MFLRLWIYFSIISIHGFGTHALENLALNKEAEMSTQRTADSGADGAVDGNTAQTIDSASCALTALDKAPEAWWRVDLNGTFAISELTIYLLNTDLFRFRYCTVHITDEITDWRLSPYCTKAYWNYDGPSRSVLNLNCTSVGRYVTLWLNRPHDCMPRDFINFCDILQLCEVQVFGCYPGNYSADCNMPCPVNCRDDICSIDGGLCYECKDGYLGDMCDTACTIGKFGKNCAEICGHCHQNSACHRVNGSCKKGCAKGWEGQLCKTSCKQNTYSYNCSEKCSGNCRDHLTCNRYTGMCDAGCKKGWSGPYCNESCRWKKFGMDCLHSCDMCEETCHRETGECLNNDVMKLTNSAPVVVTASILSVIIVILIVIVVIQCRRIHRYSFRSAEGTSNPETSHDSGDNIDMNYEDLQTREADKRVYDSLDDGSVVYQNATV